MTGENVAQIFDTIAKELLKLPRLIVHAHDDEDEDEIEKILPDASEKKKKKCCKWTQ